MPTIIKVLGQAAPASTTVADLYTVGSGKTAVVSTISIANVTTTVATARVYVRVAGATATAANALVYDASIAANSTTGLTLGITLSATDVISVQSGASSALTFMAFGQENN